jgi:hypothetical protein
MFFAGSRVRWMKRASGNSARRNGTLSVFFGDFSTRRIGGRFMDRVRIEMASV